MKRSCILRKIREMASNLYQPLRIIIPGVILCTVFAKTRFFNSVAVDLGFHHYGEEANPSTFLKMPLNATVNLGYVLVGMYWLILPRQLKLPNQDIFYFDMFAIMAVIYGPTQFSRIITQHHTFAVLDQWFTLPFFCWVFVWGLYIRRDRNSSSDFEIGLLGLSVLSYLITLILSVGFEISLGVHILAATVMGTQCHQKYGNKLTRMYFVLALLYCFGFVGLKLADKYLSEKHWIFTRVSGHFLSKICDFLQIDSVARFFLEIVKAKLGMKQN